MAFDSLSLGADELLAIREFGWRGPKHETRSLVMERARPFAQRLLVEFRGVSSREQAAELTNGELLTERASLPDPGPGSAYTFQLIGLRVAADDGRDLGVLEDIVATGAHPIYVVRGSREWLIPATGEVVRRVDLEGGVITVALPRGLEDV
jgi:16S rRNA processing protein RimM